MSIRNFPTCHCHPQSLDSASTPEAFAKREMELGSGYLVATDHGSLAAARTLIALTKKKDDKGQRIYPLIPIVGLEAYFRDDRCPILQEEGVPLDEDGTYRKTWCKYHHLTIHFLDQAAYECAVRLLSKADLTAERHGQERKPIFDWSDLEELAAHNVTMTTGCLIGMVQRHLLEHNSARMAVRYYERLRALVGPGRFYVEVFPHKTDKNWVQGVFVELSDGTKLRYHDKKWLRVMDGKGGIEDVRANDLARRYTHKAPGSHYLIAVKDWNTWQPLGGALTSDTPQPGDSSLRTITKIEYIEGYLPNECRPWAPDGDVQAGCNRFMMIQAMRHGDPIIIGDDSHFAHPKEKVAQDIKLMASGGSWRFYSSYHRQSSEEALAHFRETLDIDEKTFEGWVENSFAWASRFKDFTLEAKPSLPTKFYPPDTLAHTMALIDKHGRMDWDDPVMKERLDYEINLLHRNGVIDLLPYFFVEEEVCDLYEKANMLTGPGRGSAAGLLLAYLMGITHVDPIKYGLSVDRFLTLDRIKSGKLPDIDQDLPDRDMLVNPKTGWLRQRFGDHFAQISTDTKMKLRLSVQDVHRALHGKVPPEIAELTKKFENAPQGVEDVQHVFGYKNGDSWVPGSIERDLALKFYVERYPREWEIVQMCLGLTRQKSRHACAYGIANRPIDQFIPLTTVSDVRVTQYTAESVEESGVIKYDFLGINSLKDISACLSLIRSRSLMDIPEFAVINKRRVPRIRLIPWQGQLLDVYDLPDDQKVFDDVASGRTETVFQFNTSGARKWMRHFNFRKPNGNKAIDSVEAMAAFTALDRPGPLDAEVTNPEDGSKHNMLVEYARRARGAPKSPDIFPVFEQLLPETYGVMVFQEQLQRVYQNLVGCSGPDAEEFRGNVAKKKMEKVLKAYPRFMEGATVKLGSKESAQKAWDFINTWGQYGFNKSHAVCYSVIGYVCAWLKRHFPLEWWCAVLRNADKNEINEVFWHHCGHLIDLPDVRLSGDVFEIQGERIRAPISLLDGVGPAAHEQLCAGRPYRDIQDFCDKVQAWKLANVKGKTKTGKDRLGTSALHRGVVYRLIISGAMDSLFPEGSTVLDMLALYEEAIAKAASVTKGKKVKAEAVDPRFVDLDPAQRYQLRKTILPAYSAPIMPLVRNQDARIEQGATRLIFRNDNNQAVPFVTASEIARADAHRPFPDHSITVAIVGYVESIRTFPYSNKTKTAHEYTVQMDGGTAKFVKWQRRKGPAFKPEMAPVGSIVVAEVTKFSEDMSFSIDTIEVLYPPIAE